MDFQGITSFVQRAASGSGWLVKTYPLTTLVALNLGYWVARAASREEESQNDSNWRSFAMALAATLYLDHQFSGAVPFLMQQLKSNPFSTLLLGAAAARVLKAVFTRPTEYVRPTEGLLEDDEEAVVLRGDRVGLELAALLVAAAAVRFAGPAFAPQVIWFR
ncbi:MAG: hypothetical protein AB7F31_03805 [Parachlamydiales bacterium]